MVPPEPGPEPEPEPTPEDLLEQEREAMIASRFQAKAALLGAGLLDDVEALIANSDDRFLQIAWNEAIEYRRTSPTILAMAQALSLTDEQVDDLFRLAMTIEA